MSAAPPSVFLSLATPHLPAQVTFLDQLEDVIKANGMRPRSLGRSEWSYEAPLAPIRSLMNECSGTIVVAMTRSVMASGVDYPGGVEERTVRDRHLSTPWLQIEAAMAFQLHQPILVLRESQVEPEGVLHMANTGISVRSYSLSASGCVPEEIVRDVVEFRVAVEKFAQRRTRPALILASQ